MVTPQKVVPPTALMGGAKPFDLEGTKGPLRQPKSQEETKAKPPPPPPAPKMAKETPVKPK